MTKIFLTGVTGYIGGSIFDTIYKAHPEWSYTLLIRSSANSKAVTDAYPAARLVFGDADSSDLLKAESAAADIVIHTADSMDHEGAAKAIAEGIAAGHTKDAPGYWLHTGGTGILVYPDWDAKTFGTKNEKVFDDLDGVEELLNPPDTAFHKQIDAIVLAAGRGESGERVKTVIICPPTIYGTGTGPGHRRSKQVYDLAEETFKRGKAPLFGEGKSVWNNVHILDLANLYLLYAEAAAAKRNDPELWGEKGYVLAENGEHNWADIALLVAQSATKKGLIPAAEVESLGFDEIRAIGKLTALTWGLNSRGRARRARKFLGWSPKGPALEAEIDEIVEFEKKLRGL